MNGRRERGVALAALVAVLCLVGCTGGGARFVQPSGSASAGVTLGVIPADKATDVPVSAEVGLGQGAKLEAVELTDAGGKRVPGKLRDDRSSWVPDEPLDYTTTYTARVTGKNAAGTSGTQTTTFTTMSRPGKKLRARLGLGGLPVGGGRYGQQDITIEASTDVAKRIVEVDNATKQLTARQDNQVVKTAPVSLGKPEKPSYSGTMVVMERLDKTTFDSSTYGTPVNSADGYRTDVRFAERLTWDGQFIHAAPWSVAQQGRINVSPDNAQWLFNWIKVGDPVVVKGTEQRLNQGNGWTAWDLSWEDFLKGSALTGNHPSAIPS